MWSGGWELALGGWIKPELHQHLANPALQIFWLYLLNTANDCKLAVNIGSVRRGGATMGFLRSQMPEKSFQVTSWIKVTWKGFYGMSDL